MSCFVARNSRGFPVAKNQKSNGLCTDWQEMVMEGMDWDIKDKDWKDGFFGGPYGIAQGIQCQDALYNYVFYQIFTITADFS